MRDVGVDGFWKECFLNMPLLLADLSILNSTIYFFSTCDKIN